MFKGSFGLMPLLIWLVGCKCHKPLWAKDVEAEDVEAVLSFCYFGLWPFFGLWICLAVMWSGTVRDADVLQ